MNLQTNFVAESDAVWWGRIARQALSEGRDRPARWDILHDDGADGCVPSGWYAVGLDSHGASIDWSVRHEYGPFASEAEARAHAGSVDASYANSALDSRPK